MTGVQKLYMTPTGVLILGVSLTGVQKLGKTSVKNLGVSSRCAKIGHDRCQELYMTPDRYTNIGCVTDRCANIEPDTDSHGTTIKQVK